MIGIAGALALQGLIFDSSDAHAKAAQGAFAGKSADSSYHKATGRVAVAAGVDQPDGSALSLTVGLTLNGDGTTCGSATSLTVNAGDLIDFCYTVTNNSTTAMAFSTLDDSVDGNIFTNQPTAIAAGGGTYVYHRTVTASATNTYAATWTARDLLPGYTPNDTGPSGFVDVSTSGTSMGFTSDDAIAAVTMPFSFTFYGASSDKLCVSNNGLMFFGVGAPCPTGGSSVPWYGNVALPASTLPNAAILPYWDDFGLGPGNVFYATTGTAPSRKFIVQWNNIQHYSSTPQGATFEVVLDEAAGSVAFEYSATSFGNPDYDNGASATVGLQSNATTANQYSFNTASLSAGKSIVWTSGTATVLTATASTSLDVGAPVIAVTPTSITQNVPSGSSTAVTANLSIANTGTRPLDWTLEEAPANSHFPAAPGVRRYIVPVGDVNAPPIKQAVRRGEPTSDKARLRRAPFGIAATVPAFGVEPSAGDYYSFDASAPSTVTTVGSDSGLTSMWGGAFVNNDFSTEYVLGDNGFGKVDTQTGAVTVISGTAGGGDVWGATADPTDGTFYGVGPSSAQKLYKVDLTSGATTDVGAITGDAAGDIISALAVSPAGLMYGIDKTQDCLLAIDKTNASSSCVGSLGMDTEGVASLAFDGSTGILYLSALDGGRANPSIYTVDVGTGTATLVSAIDSAAGQISAMAIATSGSGGSGCSNPSDVPWLSAAPTSGTVAPSGTPGASTVTLNPSGLADGLYSADICVNSNDRAHPTVSVPVEFTVGNVVPTAAVDPSSLDFTLEVGNNGSDTISVSNTGTPGSHLTFSVTEAATDCASPSDVAWLSASPTSGDVVVGTPASVEAAVDTATLAAGSYSAKLCLATNDPAHATISIPVTLTVTPPDLIFKDGFDGAQPMSISQMQDQTPVEQNSVACAITGTSLTRDNQYWRRYVLSEHSVPPSFGLTSVDVSIESAVGTPTVTVTVYTIPSSVAADTIDVAQLTQVGTAQLAAPADAALTSMNVPVTGNVTAAGNDLVVEVATADESDSNFGFFIGSNPSAETHPSFLSSTACGITDPTPTADIGFANMHIIETVNIE